LDALKRERESTVVTAQHLELGTNCFKKNSKEETGSKCQLCKKCEETIDRMTSGCSILAKNVYIIRHDNFYTHLHYSVWKELGIDIQQKTDADT